ncbi:MAG: hypothetical protein JWM12_1776 [Ilumatobacteraceae bacterium]|nr:hypothetical protein [Ilumatobacteraceae bacterium]
MTASGPRHVTQATETFVGRGAAVLGETGELAEFDVWQVWHEAGRHVHFARNGIVGGDPVADRTLMRLLLNGRVDLGACCWTAHPEQHAAT